MCSTHDAPERLMEQIVAVSDLLVSLSFSAAAAAAVSALLEIENLLPMILFCLPKKKPRYLGTGCGDIIQL